MRRLDEYLKEADNERGYILASLTDEYIVDKWPMEYCNLKGKEDKILEIRIFNDDKELKIYRTDIGKEFSCSIIKEDDYKDNDKVDEEQYLDIDTKKTKNNHEVYSTGGGKYNLPLEKLNDAKIQIRYYIDRYEESGVARVCNWRCIALKEGK